MSRHDGYEGRGFAEDVTLTTSFFIRSSAWESSSRASISSTVVPTRSTWLGRSQGVD